MGLKPHITEIGRRYATCKTAFLSFFFKWHSHDRYHCLGFQPYANCLWVKTLLAKAHFLYLTFNEWPEGQSNLFIFFILSGYIAVP